MPPFSLPRPNDYWRDDMERWGLEPMPEIEPRRIGQVIVPKPVDEVRWGVTHLPVDTLAQWIAVERHVLDDTPRLQATLRDEAYRLAQYAAEQGKRYITRPQVTVTDATPWPERIPDPWWRKALIAVGLARPRYTEPTPRYALRTEVRAA